MALSQNPNTYRHVKPILDAVLEHGQGRYTLPSEREAIRWRMEAYQYRKLLAKSGPTLYDNIVIQLEGMEAILTFRKVSGTFVTEDGTKINLDREIPAGADPLLDFANSLFLQLDGNDNDD